MVICVLHNQTNSSGHNRCVSQVLTRAGAALQNLALLYRRYERI